MFRKALDIKLEVLPNNHSEVMDLYMYLATSLKKQGKFPEATKIHKLQLEPLVEMHGEDHPGVVLAYNGIAALLALQNRLDDALQMLDKAIEICYRLPRLGDLDIGILGGTLLSKAKTLEDQGNVEAVVETLNKVLTIQVEPVGEMNPRTVKTYEELALAYVRRGMTEGAIKAYTKAIKLVKKSLAMNIPTLKSLC
ncbi:unnamed protein product [Cylindrotheca closterium]|uniref:Kinesin light chain n=1 Tax=Cylindrotheca closterium TaxID=2856 RepID=A0AAD2CFV4_9STRA|nr:unnamed protein product [Cylindrotheca closterium]